MQPLCTTNTTRWFILTARKFIYLKDEAGEGMRYLVCALVVALLVSRMSWSLRCGVWGCVGGGGVGGGGVGGDSSVSLGNIEFVGATSDSREFKVSHTGLVMVAGKG